MCLEVPWREKYLFEYYPIQNFETAAQISAGARINDSPNNTFRAVRIHNDTHDMVYAEVRIGFVLAAIISCCLNAVVVNMWRHLLHNAGHNSPGLVLPGSAPLRVIRHARGSISSG